MKFCLNEINSFVLVIFFNEADIKAEYSVVTNIGGMIPQHIFLPIEEISYNMFSKLEKEGDISTGEKQRQKEAILINIMKVMNLLGLLLIIFGMRYTEIIFDFLFDGKYTTPTCI